MINSLNYTSSNPLRPLWISKLYAFRRLLFTFYPSTNNYVLLYYYFILLFAQTSRQALKPHPILKHSHKYFRKSQPFSCRLRSLGPEVPFWEVRSPQNRGLFYINCTMTLFRLIIVNKCMAPEICSLKDLLPASFPNTQKSSFLKCT